MWFLSLHTNYVKFTWTTRRNSQRITYITTTDTDTDTVYNILFPLFFLGFFCFSLLFFSLFFVLFVCVFLNKKHIFWYTFNYASGQVKKVFSRNMATFCWPEMLVLCMLVKFALRDLKSFCKQQCSISTYKVTMFQCYRTTKLVTIWKTTLCFWKVIRLLTMSSKCFRFLLFS